MISISLCFSFYLPLTSEPPPSPTPPRLATPTPLSERSQDDAGSLLADDQQTPHAIAQPVYLIQQQPSPQDRTGAILTDRQIRIPLSYGESRVINIHRASPLLSSTSVASSQLPSSTQPLPGGASSSATAMATALSQIQQAALQHASSPFYSLQPVGRPPACLPQPAATMHPSYTPSTSSIPPVSNSAALALIHQAALQAPASPLYPLHPVGGPHPPHVGISHQPGFSVAGGPAPLLTAPATGSNSFLGSAAPIRASLSAGPPSLGSSTVPTASHSLTSSAPLPANFPASSQLRPSGPSTSLPLHHPTPVPLGLVTSAGPVSGPLATGGRNAASYLSSTIPSLSSSSVQPPTITSKTSPVTQPRPLPATAPWVPGVSVSASFPTSASPLHSFPGRGTVLGGGFNQTTSAAGTFLVSSTGSVCTAPTPLTMSPNVVVTRSELPRTQTPASQSLPLSVKIPATISGPKSVSQSSSLVAHSSASASVPLGSSKPMSTSFVSHPLTTTTSVSLPSPTSSVFDPGSVVNPGMFVLGRSGPVGPQAASASVRPSGNTFSLQTAPSSRTSSLATGPLFGFTSSLPNFPPQPPTTSSQGGPSSKGSLPTNSLFGGGLLSGYSSPFFGKQPAPTSQGSTVDLPDTCSSSERSTGEQPSHGSSQESSSVRGADTSGAPPATSSSSAPSFIHQSSVMQSSPLSRSSATQSLPLSISSAMQPLPSSRPSAMQSSTGLVDSSVTGGGSNMAAGLQAAASYPLSRPSVTQPSMVLGAVSITASSQEQGKPTPSKTADNSVKGQTTTSVDTPATSGGAVVAANTSSAFSTSGQVTSNITKPSGESKIVDAKGLDGTSTGKSITATDSGLPRPPPLPSPSPPPSSVSSISPHDSKESVAAVGLLSLAATVSHGGEEGEGGYMYVQQNHEIHSLHTLF